MRVEIAYVEGVGCVFWRIGEQRDGIYRRLTSGNASRSFLMVFQSHVQLFNVG